MPSFPPTHVREVVSGEPLIPCPRCGAVEVTFGIDRALECSGCGSLLVLAGRDPRMKQGLTKFCHRQRVTVSL